MNNIQLRLLNPFTNTNIHGWQQIGHMLACSTTIQALEFNHGEIVILLDGYIFDLEELCKSYRGYHENKNDDHTMDNKMMILIEIYKSYGFDYLLHLLEGNYVLILLDQRARLDEATLYIVQDPSRTRPLYIDGSGFLISTTPGHGLTLYNNTDGLLYKRSYLVNQPWKKSQYHCKYFPIPKMPLINYDDILDDIFLIILKKIVYHGGEARTIINIRGVDDIESKLITKYLQEIKNVSILDIVVDNFPDPLFIKDEITKNDIDISNCRIFMSSGVMEIARNIKSITMSKMHFDHDFQKSLSDISNDELIPVIFEPFREQGMLVEFPCLHYSWLKVYMASIK